MLRKLIPFLLCASAAAQLNLTATHLTMKQGQPVPPLIWTWNTPTAASSCTGEPSLTTTATPASAPGTYPISVAAGTLSCTGYTLSFTAGSLVVLAADGIGASISTAVSYPPGFLSGPSGAASPEAIDVTSNATCNLDPTGATDGTSCFNTLAARFMNTNCSTQPSYVSWLYFPPGTYTLAGPLLPCGNGWHIMGSGTGQTILRIPPNTSAYNTASDAPWFEISSVGGNSNFRESIENLTIDVGYGNPKIQTLWLAMNNVGYVRNVVMYSEDSQSDEMVFLHSYPGPALFKNVAIYGGNYALWSNQIEYSWTFDQFTTEGQQTVALNPGSTKLNLQHWLSDNTVPALSVANNGGIALLDSQILNGSAGNTAITNVATSSVYARNVTVTGYGTSNADSGTGSLVNYTGNLTEKWTGTASNLFNTVSSPHSLGLPQSETPEPSDPSPSTWTQLSASINNWGNEVAAATSSTVYAAPGQYTGTSGTVNIVVPDSVNHLQFYGAIDSSQQPKLQIVVRGSSATPLVIDRCVYDACTLVHTGKRAVVIRDTYLNTYQPAPGAGNVYFEDDSIYSGSITNYFTVFPRGQSVWGRQFNAESRTGPEIQCSGCTLWILGLKTENSPDLDPVTILSNSAQAEIFGSFIYPLAASTAGNSPYAATNSQQWIAPTFEYVNVNGYGWPYWQKETQAATTSTLATPSQNSGNYLLNAYYGYGNGNGYSYFISNSGLDSNDGLTPQTPWQTVAKVNSFLTANGTSPLTGVSFLFQRGGDWHEELSCISNLSSATGWTTATHPPMCSGSAGYPMTVGAYGTGSSPILDEADPLSLTWTLVTGTTWQATVSGTMPSKLFVDGATAETTALIPVPNATGTYSGTTTYNPYDGVIASNSDFYIRGPVAPSSGTDPTANNEAIWLDNTNPASGNTSQAFSTTNTGLQNVESIPGSWYGTGTTIYVNLADGSNPNSHSFEGTQRPYGVLLQSENYVTVRDLAIEHPLYSGIVSTPWSNDNGTYFTGDYDQFINNHIYNWGTTVTDALTSQQSPAHKMRLVGGIAVSADLQYGPHLLRGILMDHNTIGREDGYLGQRDGYYSIYVAGLFAAGIDGGGASNFGVMTNNSITAVNVAGMVYNTAALYTSTPPLLNLGGGIYGNYLTNNQGNIYFSATSGGAACGNTVMYSYGEAIQLGGESTGPQLVCYNLFAHIGVSASAVLYNGSDCNTTGQSVSGIIFDHNTVADTNSANVTWEATGSTGCTGETVTNNIFDENLLRWPQNDIINPSYSMYFTNGYGNVGQTFNHNLWLPGTNANPWHSSALQYSSCSSYLTSWPDTSSQCGVDPQFVSPSGSNFHLQSTSPARGAGTNGSDLGALPYSAGSSSANSMTWSSGMSSQ